MILKEFRVRDRTKFSRITKALHENYDYKINYDNLTLGQAGQLTRKALQRVDSSKDINDRIKFKMIAESLELWMQANVQTELTDMVAESLDDEEVEEAKVILAAKEISDKLQNMIEDTAKMQVQDLIPIIDTMKTDIGNTEANDFSEAADAALGQLVDTLKSTKEEYDRAVASVQGQRTDMDDFNMNPDDIGGEDDFGDDPELGGGIPGGDDMGVDDLPTDGDPDADLGIDDFGGDDANVVGDEPTGRELKDEI